MADMRTKISPKDKRKVYEVNTEALKKASKVFKEMIELTTDDTTSSRDEVLTLNVNAEILADVVDYIEKRYAQRCCKDPMHDDDEEDLHGKYICMGDKAFIKGRNCRQVILLSQAAEFLEIPALNRLCVQAMTAHLSGRSAGSMRQALSLHNDFSNAEENMVRKENEWCVDLKTMKF